jgi:hypothetical protein
MPPKQYAPIWQVTETAPGGGTWTCQGQNFPGAPAAVAPSGTIVMVPELRSLPASVETLVTAATAAAASWEVRVKDAAVPEVMVRVHLQTGQEFCYRWVDGHRHVGHSRSRPTIRACLGMLARQQVDAGRG